MIFKEAHIFLVQIRTLEGTDSGKVCRTFSTKEAISVLTASQPARIQTVSSGVSCANPKLLKKI